LVSVRSRPRASGRAIGGRELLRERLVLGQQGEHGVDLAALEGIGEVLRCLSQPPVGDHPQRRVPAFVRQSFLGRAAGAEERPVDRCDGRGERGGRLLRGEAERVAEDERGPLAGR
jgi:hypothetical protein